MLALSRLKNSSVSFCCYWVYRAEKEWEELQTEVGELLEARPQEGADNST